MVNIYRQDSDSLPDLLKYFGKRDCFVVPCGTPHNDVPSLSLRGHEVPVAISGSCGPPKVIVSPFPHGPQGLSLRGAKRRGNLREGNALVVCHCEGTKCPWQSLVVVSQLGGNSRSTEKERLLRKGFALPRNDEHREPTKPGESTQ